MTSKEALECLQPFRWDDKKEIKAYEVLKELVERDTPKKVKIGTSKHFKFPICPNCKVELNEFYKNKYCKKCGQRLAWGESIYKENYLLLDEDTDIVTQINDYNNTVDIYNELEIGIKIKKQEKLLGLYRQLVKDLGLFIEYDTTDTWDGPKDYEYLEIDYDSIEALNTYKQIKELENDKMGYKN